MPNTIADFTNLEKEIRMGMNLVDRDEFTATIHAISHIAADTVKKTLGPYAHTTIIDDGNFVYPTKDGWAVLSRLRFQDPTHNSIYTMLKNISARIVDKVGDGTTTAMVVADHFMEAMDAAYGRNDQHRQKDIVDSLHRMRDRILEQLEKRAIQIAPRADEADPDFKAIYDVAYTSSNGNEKLAKIMQEIYQKTRNPNVMIDMEGGMDLSYEIQTGYRLDCEHLMHDRYVNTTERYFSSNHEKHLFVIFDHSVNYQKDGELIQLIMNYADQRGIRPVFMAPYYDDIISAQFAMRVNNFVKQHPGYVPNVIVIQIPEMNTKLQQYYVRDFAALADIPITDATKVKIFLELRHNERTQDPSEHITDPAMKVEGYNFTTAQALMESCMGFVSNFTIGKNFISLNETNFESVIYKERLAQAQDEYEKATEEMKNSTTTLMKGYLEASQRLNKLSGALGVIHVGGTTDLERQCTRDVVDDTFRACRSAYESGVVPGMNMGTLCAIHNVALQVMESDPNGIDFKTLQMLNDAYVAATKDVLHNKKASGTWKYATQDEIKTLSDDALVQQIKMDILKGEISGYDIVEERPFTSYIPKILNSVATDVEILQAIIGMLGMILTSDQYLSVNRFYDKSAAIRQQESLNEITTKNKVNSILTALDSYLKENPDSDATQLIGSLFHNGGIATLSIPVSCQDNSYPQKGQQYDDYLGPIIHTDKC